MSNFQVEAEQPRDEKPSRGKWRIKLLVLFGLVAIGAGYAYKHFFLSWPIGEGPAGPSVPSAAFESIWTDHRILLLGVGDSITDGFGAQTRSHGYFERLLRNPTDEFPEMQGICLSAVLPNLEARNMSVSGSTSFAHLDLISEDLETQDLDVFGLVVMTTGGNDLIHNYGKTEPRENAIFGATVEQAKPWVARFEERLTRMLDLISERFPGGCEVFLADIYDPTDGVGDALSVYLPDWPDGLKIHSAYNDVIYRQIESRKNVNLVPLHKTFLGHGSHCRQPWLEHYCKEDPSYWFHTNVEDPNDRGYDAIRRIFLVEIERVADRLRSLPQNEE